MAICYKETTVEWKVRVSGKGYETREEAKDAARKSVRNHINAEAGCEGDDCLNEDKCRATSDPDDREALIHIFSYDDDDGNELYGFRIKKGSKIAVTCDCVPTKPVKPAKPSRW